MVLSYKLLSLGIVALSGVVISGGLLLLPSKASLESRNSEEVKSITRKFNTARRHKISPSPSLLESGGCVIYWVDKVFQDSDSNETSFDELKHEYSGKEQFFQGASIREDEKSKWSFDTLCSDGSTSYFYVWQDEEGGWDRTTGGKYLGVNG